MTSSGSTTAPFHHNDSFFVNSSSGGGSGSTSLNNNMNDEDEYSERELKTIAIVGRLAAGLSFLSALVMAKTAYRNRRRLYHRFMLALSIHLIIFSITQLVGTAAIPHGTPNTWGVIGTVGTCSAQGFFIQVSMCAPFYYVLMSLYSFLAVWHNFKVEQYLWVEKWIHFAVHVFPLSSAVYLLALQAYNQPGDSVGTVCWIDSLPFGCGDDNVDTIPCTRGPQNISQVAGIFAGLPVLFIMIVPAVVMSALYVQVRRHQARIKLAARAVAKQASVYVLALYWSYGLTIVKLSLGWIADHDCGFVMKVLALVSMNAIGFWFLLVYIYFWMPQPTSTSSTSTVPEQEQSTAPTGEFTERYPESSSKGSKTPASFNIFDGTNPTGAFAEFVFQGDSEDEEADREETNQWSAIQDHI